MGRLSGLSHGITKVVIRGRREGWCQRGRCEDDTGHRVRERPGEVTLLTWKMDERVSGQGMQAASRIQKRQRNGFLSGASRKNKILLTP